MTISVPANRASYVENGVTTVFPFAPPFVANTDLTVTNQVGAGTPTVLVLNVDYTVTGAGSSSGGTVTRTVPGANASVLLIVRAVPFTQSSTWPNGTAFDGPTVEAAFDRAVMLVDQVSDRLDQAVLGTITANATAIANSPAGGIVAVNVQAALNELDTKKAALAGAAFTGAITVAAQTQNKVLASPNGATGTAVFRALVPADLPLASITASLGADVLLNNTANYFDGPSVAQGTVGTWFVSGTITLVGNGSSNVYVKLWDGATVIASAAVIPSAAQNLSVSLSGVLASPAGNLRMSAKNINAVVGVIAFNATGNAKDSTITALRIA